MATDIPSRARSFFSKIKASTDGANFIKTFISAPLPPDENEFLDFKDGRTDFTNKEFEDSWAKNLSGFANSDGGVLIFGVEDKEKRLSPVQDISGCIKVLNDRLSYMTEPPVSGIEIIGFPETPNANVGFVVCFIPSSPWRPHQVKVGKKSNVFYIRAGSNCNPCSVAILRALFAPQSVAQIDLNYEFGFEPDPINPRNKFPYLKITLVNGGPSTAKEVVISCAKHEALSLVPDYERGAWNPIHRADDAMLISLFCSLSIHPKQAKYALFLHFKEPHKLLSNLQKMTSLRLSASALDQPPIDYSITFNWVDIQTLKKGKAQIIAS